MNSGAGIRLLALLAVMSVIAPLLYILSSWLAPDWDIWRHLVDTQLAGLLRNTIVLVIGVGLGVTVLGVSLAWLTASCEFPGRRWFDWALMLPLAVPAYVLAFVLLGVFDFGGPVQAVMQQWVGPGYRFVDVRHPAVVVLVMSLVLYPYVYLLARSAFVAQGSDVLEAARSLGCSGWQGFLRVAVPMARPAIVAGVSLALMETLADFGTVSIFNYDTFTTAIYKSWFGFFSLQVGAQLASLLLLFVGLALISERTARGSSRFTQQGRAQHNFRISLRGWRAWLACAYAGGILSLGFLLPALQLFLWTLGDNPELIDGRFLGLLGRSLLLAVVAATGTVAVALLTALVRQRSAGLSRVFLDLSNLGYAIPGSVLAVGIVLLLTDVDRLLWLPLGSALGLSFSPLVGSLVALLLAYWVRFVAVASGPLDSGLGRIKPSIPEAAQSLGATKVVLLTRIYLPMLRPGVLTALLLVFVDVLKEMPATLLLRPFGWDTLAVRVYALTAEGEWQWAAQPALVLVVAGLPPVFLLLRRSIK